MADNTTLNAGTGGDVIASDDIAGVKYQRVKVTFGADGAAADVEATAPLPVSLTDGTDAALVTASGALTVDGSAVTQPVSAASLPLPTGAATAAKQPALGTAGTASADVLSVQGIASMTALVVDGSGVTQPVSNAGLTALNGAIAGTEVQVDIVGALPAGTNAIGKLAANSGVDIGDVDVASIAAGSNLIGRVNIDPQTGNGLTIFRSIDLDETEEEVKATAGAVYGWYLANLATSTRYVKFYNATAANTTVGTTTPVITIVLPGNSTDAIAANALGGMGIAFDTAISVAATTGLADNDTGAPGAGEVVANIFYK